MNRENFSDAALVVLGHGTTLNDQSAAPVLQHAAELRRRKIFAEVREGFWKQEPQIKTVLAGLAAPRIFIVPFFISEGYFSTEIIPKELGFPAVPSTLNSQLSTLHYCLPVGSHDSMTTVILARAKEVVEKFPFPRAPKPADTTLLIAGHGTERNANSRKAVGRQADLIRALKIFAEVGAVFMEEAPFIKGCHQNVKTKYVVVVPFFISDGLHAVEDLPVLLGEPERLVKERLAAGQPTWRNPTERDGKLIWYAPSVGTEPLLAEVILQRVREAARVEDGGWKMEDGAACLPSAILHLPSSFKNESMKKLRIGFLSTAGIGRKNWKAILNSGNCVVVAVASRDVQKSREFIRHCQTENSFGQTPDALGSYEELLAAKNVDAIYVPLPTGLRKDLVIRAAQNGKHILCEKPCASNVAELEAMLAACKKNSVQFLDGVMFMHNPRLPKIREVLADGKSVGPIRRIASAFSFYPGEEFFSTNIRANGALEPAGCVGDLGWYSIRFSLWALGWQMPESVAGKILSCSENLPGRRSSPTEFSATLNYPGGVTAEFYSSFLAAKQQWAFVSGQKGWLRLPDFVHPFNGYEPAFEVNEKFVTVAGEVKCPPGADPLGYGHATAQDTRMWRSFADQIFTCQLNDEWTLWALKTQQVLDACLASGLAGGRAIAVV